jgi:hypothetical protein
LRGK